MDYLEKLKNIDTLLSKAIDNRQYIYFSEDKQHLEGPWTRTINSLYKIFQKASPNRDYDLIKNIQEIETITNNALKSLKNDLKITASDKILEKITQVQETSNSIHTKIQILAERYHKSQGITSCKDLGSRIISRPKIAWLNPLNWGRYLRYSISFARVVYKTLTCYRNNHPEKTITPAKLWGTLDANWNKIEKYKNSLQSLKDDSSNETIKPIAIAKNEALQQDDKTLFNFYVALEKAYDLTIPYHDSFFDFIDITRCPKDLYALAQKKPDFQEIVSDDHEKNRQTLKEILEKFSACKFFEKDFDFELPNYIPSSQKERLSILKAIYEEKPINGLMVQKNKHPNFDPKPLNNEKIENNELPIITTTNTEVKKEVKNENNLLAPQNQRNDLILEKFDDQKIDRTPKIKEIEEDDDELDHDSLETVLKDYTETGWQKNIGLFTNYIGVLNATNYIKLRSSDLGNFNSEILNNREKKCEFKKGLIVEIQENEESKTFWNNLLSAADSFKIGVIYLMGENPIPPPCIDLFDPADSDSEDDEDNFSSPLSYYSSLANNPRDKELKEKIVCSEPLYFEPQGDIGLIQFQRLKRAYPLLLVKPDKNGVMDCSKCSMKEFKVVMNTCFEKDINPLKIKFPAEIKPPKFKSWVKEFGENCESLHEWLKEGSLLDFSACEMLDKTFFSDYNLSLDCKTAVILPNHLKYQESNTTIKPISDDPLEFRKWLSSSEGKILDNGWNSWLSKLYGGLWEYASVFLIPMGKAGLLTSESYPKEWKGLDPTTVSLWLYDESYENMPENPNILEIDASGNKRLTDDNIEGFLLKFPHANQICLHGTAVTLQKLKELEKFYGTTKKFFCAPNSQKRSSGELDIYSLNENHITNYLEIENSLVNLEKEPKKQTCYLFAATFFPEKIMKCPIKINCFTNFELKVNSKSWSVNKYYLSNQSTWFQKEYGFEGNFWGQNSCTLEDSLLTPELMDLCLDFLKTGKISLKAPTSYNDYLESLKLLEGIFYLAGEAFQLDELARQACYQLPDYINKFLPIIKNTSTHTSKKNIEKAQNVIHQFIDKILNSVSLKQYLYDERKISKKLVETYKSLFKNDNELGYKPTITKCLDNYNKNKKIDSPFNTESEDPQNYLKSLTLLQQLVEIVDNERAIDFIQDLFKQLPNIFQKILQAIPQKELKTIPYQNIVVLLEDIIRRGYYNGCEKDCISFKDVILKGFYPHYGSYKEFKETLDTQIEVLKLDKPYETKKPQPKKPININPPPKPQPKIDFFDENAPYEIEGTWYVNGIPIEMDDN